MKRYIFRKAAGHIGRQAAKEGTKARNALKGLIGFIPEIMHALISMIPKMIRLSIELIQSEKVGDKAKFILIGVICVTGFAIADEFITRFTIFPIVLLLLGPISAFTSVAFYGTIKCLLLIVCFFVAVHAFNTCVEDEEVGKLATKLFGEKDAEQLLKELNDVHATLNKYFSPIADKLMTAFEKIGRRKKTIDTKDAGDAVIRAAKDNTPLLLGWSGSAQEDFSGLIGDLEKQEKDLCTEPAAV